MLNPHYRTISDINRENLSIDELEDAALFFDSLSEPVELAPIEGCISNETELEKYLADQR